MTPSLAHEWPVEYDWLQPFKPEIEAFQRKVHERVLDPLLRLFALLLELPEDYFSAVRPLFCFTCGLRRRVQRRVG